ncbi:MAG TPA: hypothetical protein VNA68_00695 [Candidatus Dormibacteraeota bacterium]|nr:hypothetical protein [Candidatus Dormibacteraeota bacterium]
MSGKLEPTRVRSEVLPADPQPVFALVLNFTDLSDEHLAEISILSGGSDRTIIQVEPELFNTEKDAAGAWQKLCKLLAPYTYEMLFILVPWGFRGFEQIVEAIYLEQGRDPFTLIQVGYSVYEMGMGMRLINQPGALEVGSGSLEEKIR